MRVRTLEHYAENIKRDERTLDLLNEQRNNINVILNSDETKICRAYFLCQDLLLKDSIAKMESIIEEAKETYQEMVEIDAALRYKHLCEQIDTLGMESLTEDEQAEYEVLNAARSRNT